MYIIKNRVTGEYDRMGHRPFDKIQRHAWSTLGQAKNHIAMRISPNNNRYPPEDELRWYCDADFIEITEDENSGTNLIPVVSYLQQFLDSKSDYAWGYKLTEELRALIWAKQETGNE